MREIKFRVWDTMTKQMIYNVFPRNSHGDVVSFDYDINPHGTLIFVELMQFTGLFDKNRKEIYEGDIVRLPNEDICEIQYKADWDYSGFLAISVTKLYGTESYKYWSGKVIGNVYENPELLKEK